MGPRLKSSRRHTSGLKHRWPRPPPSLVEVCGSCPRADAFVAVCFALFSCHLFLSSFELSLCVQSVEYWLGGTTAGGARYYRLYGQAVLPPTRAVLPLGGGIMGLCRGRGRFLLPHTHSHHPFVPLPLSSDSSPREGSGGPPSLGHPSPFPSVESIPTSSSCHGCRYCPRSLFLLV